MLSFNQHKNGLTQEMKNWFDKRTKQHIQWVKEFGQQIQNEFPQYKGLVSRCEKHDANKFEEPFYTPYVHLTWKCIHKDHHIPDNIDITNITQRHVKSNKHHPEYWCDEDDVINSEDRDKPNKLIDASKMDDLSIAEMCADWLSVSREYGTNPLKWYEDNIDVRWSFTNKQKKQIFDILTTIWGNEDEEL